MGQPPAPPPVGTCGGGCWASPAASPVGANGRRRSVGSGGRMPGGACSFAPSIWSGAACLPNRDQRLPHQVHCSYPVGQNSARRLTSSHPIQETFCDRALAQRRLQARAQARARRSAPVCYNLSSKHGGGILEVLKIAKYALLDPYGPLGTPKPLPGSCFRIVRHLISDSVMYFVRTRRSCTVRAAVFRVSESNHTQR